MTSVMNAPYRKTPLPMWKVLSLKLGVLTTAAMIGWIRSCTSAFTTFTNAAPITNATASSSRFPRSRNALNSLSMLFPSFVVEPGM